MAFKLNVALAIQCFVAISGFSEVRAERAADIWAAVNTPSQVLPGQSIGSYAEGCIGGAVALPLSGTGYQVMRISRNRYHGHASLVEFIENLGQTVAADGLGTLLIGDLGQPRGGPTPTGHRSHQTGLDVDIWFMLSDQAEARLLTRDERETWSAPSVLGINFELDSRQWTDAHEKILKAAAIRPEVDRIFVNPAIKQDLCKHKAPSSAEWLGKIRPWWKHDDHFHVRLKCPDNNPYCVSQESVPSGDGCDASLAWWFSKEARTPGKIPPPKPIKLPALCEQVLTNSSGD
ncbi:MAG: penicillin-insensitive murein endopeptidase [Gammaproteobacteria bacterium]